MAGFGFTEAQEMFRSSMRDFTQTELAPGARERAKQATFSRELLKKMGDFGILGLNAPEKYGGQTCDWITVGIAIEEVSKVELMASLPVLLSSGMGILLGYGSEETQQEWLEPTIKGEKMIGFLLTEPDCGSDATAIKTRARKDGNSYIVNGEKTSVTMGMQLDAGVLFAKTDPDAGAAGVSCFILPLSLPGISKSSFPDIGWECLGRASAILDDVSIPERYLLGEEGKGFYMAMHEFDFFRSLLALAALGQAQASLEETMNYAKQRKAFGRPIAKFEGVSFKIAEHATLIEAGRLLCYRALWLRDQGLPHTKDAAMCKWWCPEVAVACIHDCLLIHGHLGYSQEYPVEQRLRDTIGLEIGDGTAQIMKLIITRELLGREFLPY